MKRITLGVFEVGQRVRPKDEKGYGGKRTGTVVEVSGERIRVLWDARPELGDIKKSGAAQAKRTWMAKNRLVQVVQRSAPDPLQEPQPAVGPGGWCLDTNN